MAIFTNLMAIVLSYIVADDDLIYRELTQQHLALIPSLQCIAVCENAKEVQEQLQRIIPDLLILDVEMPGFSGIQLAKSLTQLPMIIFISSHSQYAADAFEVDAVDYLVKPVAPERLMRAVEKVRVLAEMKNTISATEGFSAETEDSFFIKEKNAFIRINYTSVLYIESLGDFISIYLENGDKKIALVSMKNLEQQLPPAKFIRISRSQMVNKQKISAIDHSTIHLNKVQLHIGKTYLDQVMQAVIGNSAIKRFI